MVVDIFKLLLYLVNFYKQKDKSERVKNIFNREYKRKDSRSIGNVCDQLFDINYKQWKGIYLFEHIIDHLKATGKMETLTLGEFVEALNQSGFTDTVLEIVDVLKKWYNFLCAENFCLFEKLHLFYLNMFLSLFQSYFLIPSCNMYQNDKNPTFIFSKILNDRYGLIFRLITNYKKK